MYFFKMMMMMTME